jgi:hypothetical protein
MVRSLALLFLVLVLMVAPISRGQDVPEKAWRFAISGDSRNCGDVVMPSIAKSVLEHQAEFYWHLGDFRLGYDRDEDMKQEFGDKLTIEEYHRTAWDNFIAEQINPFGGLSVHLGIGNHELYLCGNTQADERTSHGEFIKKFSKWLGGSTTAYYRWKLRNIDFINLDNSEDQGFDTDQLNWLKSVLDEDASNNIRAVVVGMHRALPNSLACGHSMNGDPYSSPEDNRKSAESGRTAYRYLWQFQNTTGKGVYVIASHSHFYMENIFNTPYWNNRNEKDPEKLKAKNEKEETTLKGWLVGTAGAKRYRLPDGLPTGVPAVTYAYGYLLGVVSTEGKIDFRFQQITEDNIPSDTQSRFGTKFVDMCFLVNRDDTAHPPEASCNEQ